MTKKNILESKNGKILVRTKMVGNKILKGIYFIGEDGVEKTITQKTFSSLIKYFKNEKLFVGGVEIKNSFVPTLKEGVIIVNMYELAQ